MLNFRPDLTRLPQGGKRRPASNYPPIWRGATFHQKVEGPDFFGRYRVTPYAENSCCISKPVGPTQVCVVDDFGFLIAVDLEGDVR